jgi:hypothetical protein
MAENEMKPLPRISLGELLDPALTERNCEVRIAIAQALYDIEVKCGRATAGQDLEEIMNAAWDQIDATFDLLRECVFTPSAGDIKQEDGSHNLSETGRWTITICPECRKYHPYSIMNAIHGQPPTCSCWGLQERNGVIWGSTGPELVAVEVVEANPQFLNTTHERKHDG